MKIVKNSLRTLRKFYGLIPISIPVSIGVFPTLPNFTTSHGTNGILSGARFYPYDAECFIEYLQESGFFDEDKKVINLTNHIHHIYFINSDSHDNDHFEYDEDLKDEEDEWET